MPDEQGYKSMSTNEGGVAATEDVYGVATEDLTHYTEGGKDIDLPEDIYGATMFSIVFDLWDINNGSYEGDELHDDMNKVRLCFVTTVLMANYLLQAGMIWWIYIYVVLPSVHGVQRIYQKYHAEVFDEDGTYKVSLWDQWDQGNRDALCDLAFSSYWFMFAILCLWGYTMLIEIRKTDRLMREIVKVADCESLGDMVCMDAPDEVVRFVKITKFIDWVLFLVIIVPKYLIGFSLLLLGCVWLMATDSFADLILNAVALEFVVNIDNLLFEACLPQTIVTKVGNTKFWVKNTFPTAKEAKEHRASEVAWGYYRSMFYTFGIPLATWVMMGPAQNIPYAGVFPQYSAGKMRDDAQCPGHQQRITDRVCLPGVNCFPFGMGGDD
jgi:hypothetical protein